MIAKGNNQSIELVPAKMHPAICYAVVDLGTQVNPVYNKEQRKCVIVFELPLCRIEVDGKDLPRAISKTFTLSLNRKAHLRQHLESWRGQAFTEEELENGFEMKKILGVNCQLNVVHGVSKSSGNKFAKIDSILPMADGQEKRINENPLTYYSMDENMDIPPDVPDWIVDMIMDSVEMKVRSGLEFISDSIQYGEPGSQEPDNQEPPPNDGQGDDPTDDIPF